jgi:hypothetical protein
MTQMEAFLTRRDALAMPWTESLLESSADDEERCDMARRFHDDGLVVLDGVFSEELIDAILGDYPRLLDPDQRFQTRPDKPSMLTHDPKRADEVS